MKSDQRIVQQVVYFRIGQYFGMRPLKVEDFQIQIRRLMTHQIDIRIKIRRHLINAIRQTLVLCRSLFNTDLQ